MTDIWGNPTPHRIYVPVHPYCPVDGTPFVRLGAEFMESAVVVLYIVFALLYFFGFASGIPRTGWCDTLAAAAVVPSLLVGAYWSAVRRIPRIGSVIYFLPGLAVAMLPFALDFYLMFGR
jgi:hypothetical protein